MSDTAKRVSDDGAPSIETVEMTDGDIVFFDEDEPSGFIRADPEDVVDLNEVWAR